MMKMTNDQGLMIDDQIMTIAVPGQIRQKLGSEILSAVPAQVIVGLGVSGRIIARNLLLRLSTDN